MNENYTKGIQKILKYAKDEAVRLGQTYVGSEHLLLGILKDKHGNAASTLLILGCNLNKIIKSIESVIVINDSPSNIRHLPLTRRAERILKNAYNEAKNVNNKIANQNHLLLAIAKENDGLTNDIFKSSSIDYDIIISIVKSDSLDIDIAEDLNSKKIKLNRILQPLSCIHAT